MARRSLKCSCGKVYEAYDHDIKMGYGKSCSRSCMLRHRMAYTESLVPAIRGYSEAGINRQQISKKLGISRATLYGILKRHGIEVRYSNQYLKRVRNGK